MNSSGQVYSYVEFLTEMGRENKIRLKRDTENAFAYQIEYKENVRDRYDAGIRKHYIQCFGRNPKRQDIEKFCATVKNKEFYKECNKLFLLSIHGNRQNNTGDERICEENYEDYLANIHNIFSGHLIERVELLR